MGILVAHQLCAVHPRRALELAASGIPAHARLRITRRYQLEELRRLKDGVLEAWQGVPYAKNQKNFQRETHDCAESKENFVRKKKKVKAVR